MESTLSLVDRGKNKSLSYGLGIVLMGLLATAIAIVDVRFVAAPFVLLALGWICHFINVGQIVPREPVSWLYTSTIFITCWAPALGTAGTVARFGIACVVIFVLLVVSHKNEAPLPGITKVGIAILCLSLVISGVGAASSGYGIARLLNWTMFLPLLWLAYRRPHVKGIIFGIVLTCVFQMAGVGLQVAGVMGGTWGGLLTSGTSYNPESSSWLRRYTGFIGNPNNLALLLACGVIVLAACLLSQVPTRLKVAILGLITLFTVGIVVSGSRGGLVAVGLGVMVVFMAAGRRGVALGIMSASIAATMIQIGASEELDRVVASFNEILAGTDASAVQRSGVWMTKIGSAGDSSLVLGSGFGGHAPGLFANQRGLDIDGMAARMATVDNSWLKLVLESGIVGVMGMAATLLYPMFGSLFKSAGGHRLWGIAAGAVMAALIWRSISVDMLDQNPWNAIIFLTIGFAIASFHPEAGKHGRLTTAFASSQLTSTSAPAGGKTTGLTFTQGTARRVQRQ